MATALLTGASSGVGAAVAAQLVSDGHTVTGVARNQQRLSEQADSLGDRYRPVAGDLGDLHAIPTLAERACTALDGCPDILIHNAGIFSLGPFDALPATRAEEILRVNTLAPMLLTQALLPAMKMRGAGRIIVIASVAGTHGLPGQAAYCASKHGVVGFADALSAELQGSGIVVHTVCPGGIDTPLWRSGTVAYPGDLDATMQPTELADLIAFLINQPSGTRYRRIIMFPDNEWH